MYIFVSLPLKGSKEQTWKLLQEKVTAAAFDTPTYKLFIPELRVGTLDSLLSLSDDLVKVNIFVEGVSIKIRRQIEEMDRVIGGEASALGVDGVPLESYITRFAWDEAKYPLMNPLKETVDAIHDSVSKLEEELKVRLAEYNAVKSQLNALNRKTGGSLLVKDVSGLISEEQVVNTEHMTTLLVVVSKFSEKEWLTTYESLATFVVPRSSQKVEEDNEYILFSVVLFRKVVDAFKHASREKGFQVREFEFDPSGVAEREKDLLRLQEDQESMRAQLQQWCNTSYGEVFSSLLHVAAIRIFAESILRYGLPPAYQAAVLAPTVKSVKKVRAVLDVLAATDDSSFWKTGDGDSSMAGLAGGDADFHPYVSVSINYE